MITVYEVLFGFTVVKVCRSLKSAHKMVNKLDLEYGAAKHWIRETKYSGPRGY